MKCLICANEINDELGWCGYCRYYCSTIYGRILEIYLDQLLNNVMWEINLETFSQISYKITFISLDKNLIIEKNEASLYIYNEIIDINLSDILSFSKRIIRAQIYV